MREALQSPLCWQFAVDVGGTFTDCIARDPAGRLHEHKLLSSGAVRGIVGELDAAATTIVDSARVGEPADFYVGWSLTPAGARFAGSDAACVSRFDANRGALTLDRAVAGLERGTAYELSSGLPAPVVTIRRIMDLPLASPVGAVRVRLGTTRGTNALLERSGGPAALVVTEGFADVLRIGHQDRPRLFDLHIRKPADLFARVIEASERIDAAGFVLRALDEARLREALHAAREAGIASVAICLLHSPRNAAHEARAAAIAGEVGFEHVSVSSLLSPQPGLVDRARTTLVDAYLAPVMRGYVASLRAAMPAASIQLMTSAGTLVPVERFAARDCVLSGPAGGAIGAAFAGRAVGKRRVIGLDMGGTSTDVCRCDEAPELRQEIALTDEATGAAIRVRAPMLAIETIAAGGGSVCGFDGIKLTVGPQSAGADPGPACYGRGGPLCLTDVNCLLGRLPDEQFPIPIDAGAARQRLDECVERIAAARGIRPDAHELCRGWIDLAASAMASAVRRISAQRGFDPREHALVAFGGAGGQHACAVARELRIETIIAPAQAGLLSAAGIAEARLARHAESPLSLTLDGSSRDEEALRRVQDEFRVLCDRAATQLRADGVLDEAIAPPTPTVDARAAGQESVLTLSVPQGGNWRAAFDAAHLDAYGFALPERHVELCAARVVAAERAANPPCVCAPTSTQAPEPAGVQRAWFDGAWREAPLFEREKLKVGDRFDGPAIVCGRHDTLVIEPGWSGIVYGNGTIVVRDSGAQSRQSERSSTHEAADSVDLALFNARFAAIAEEMGATLRRAALSTNVKHRLDYSCAVFDGSGGLVANAPHIPVHLGAMGECVRCLMSEIRDADGRTAFEPGVAYVTNDPYRGGSHLPDVTVVSPVFADRALAPAFFVASRAHHAEIGGLLPGSMPPISRSLADEGVLIPPTAVRIRPDAGESFEDGALRRILSSGPLPSRAVEQNLADIAAQLAANRRGERGLRELVERFGENAVQTQMAAIQHAAARYAAAALARAVPEEAVFADALDDGTLIAVTIRRRGERVVFDFTGSGAVHPGNLNATPAIVCSSVLYCVRCLLAEDVPLNGGLLDAVDVVIPPGVLNPPSPSDPAARRPAVVGGNVETSQRIVDCIFGALGVAAASQGTMNNLAFGDATRSYYETIGGGSGAGPSFAGADAVHVHMTNTRLTDVEILEARYPVRVHRFAIRRGSGGDGRHRGGDGIIREIEFLAPLDLSLLTQRRTRAPFGLSGGTPGMAGRNTLIRADGSREALPPIAYIRVRPGEAMLIETPGGGGFG